MSSLSRHVYSAILKNLPGRGGGYSTTFYSLDAYMKCTSIFASWTLPWDRFVVSRKNSREKLTQVFPGEWWIESAEIIQKTAGCPHVALRVVSVTQ